MNAYRLQLRFPYFHRGECRCREKYFKPYADECSMFTSICKSRGIGSQCVNTIGSYKCECPSPGFHLTSYDKCEDKGRLIENFFFSLMKHFNKQFKDECNDFSLCPRHDSTCVNTIGSFECSCNDGFKRNGDKCENINECDVPHHQNPCLSKQHSTCRDIHGSFECECNSGYESDTTDDECREQTHECPENAQVEGLKVNMKAFIVLIE